MVILLYRLLGFLFQWMGIPILLYYGTGWGVHFILQMPIFVKIPALARVLASLSPLAGLAAAGYYLFSKVSPWLQGAPKTKVGEASPTTKTNTRVKSSVFSFPTSSRELPLIYLTNPFRGVLILGGAGAGKSKSLIEPLISQSIAAGFTGLLYDFKFPTLAQIAKASLDKQAGTKGYFVNFEDLSRSHRLNPVHPLMMKTQAHADEYAKAILYNLNPESIKKADFWSESAQSYLTAVLWYLRQENPELCTLPHAMALLFEPVGEVVGLISQNEETYGTIASLKEAVDRKAEAQVAGVVSSLQTALRKIYTPELCWVLSGHDLDLNLNNPADPKFLTLGNHPGLASVYAPVLALLVTVAIKQMNQPGKLPSSVILDEAPTLYIPGLEQLPATARSNKVATVFGAQDISQIEDLYGAAKKNALLANLNNQFFGRVASYPTAQYVVNLWGKAYVKSESVSESKSRQKESVSTTQSLHERSRVSVQDVLSLETGEFLGQLVESNVSSFKAKIRVQKESEGVPIEAFKQVDATLMKANVSRIRAEVKALLGKGEQTAKPDTTQAPLQEDESDAPATGALDF